MIRFAVSMPLSLPLSSDFTFDRFSFKRTNLLCSMHSMLSFYFIAFEILLDNSSNGACLLVLFTFIVFICSLSFQWDFFSLSHYFAYAWFTIYNSIVMLCSNCFMCVSSLISSLFESQSLFGGVFHIFLTHTQLAYKMFYHNKIAMEISFLFDIFDNDPNNDVVNDTVYLCMSYLILCWN